MNVHHATHGLSFKLELKQCEIGCVLQDTLVECLAKMSRAPYLVSLELPGLGSDELLGVIANYCENLEVLNIQGSREAVTDRGFSRYVQESGNKAKRTLRQLDVSRCMLTQVTLVHLQELIGTYFLQKKPSEKIYICVFCENIIYFILKKGDGFLSILHSQIGGI